MGNGSENLERVTAFVDNRINETCSFQSPQQAAKSVADAAEK